MSRPTRRLRHARAAITVYFVLLGTAIATWSSRIPAIKHELHLGDAALGLALFAVPGGAVLTFPLTGRLADRFGAAALLRVTGPLAAALLIGPALAPSLPWLVGALLCFGASAGLLDVTINAAGARLEPAYGRPIMSSLHAGYSIAWLLGAGIGGLFAAAGIGPFPTFVAAAIPLAAAGAVAARWVVIPESVSRQPAAAHVAGPAAAGAPAAATTTAGTTAANVALLIWVFGLLALCGQAGEGSAGDWSAVYLHDDLGTSAGFAATGLIAFSVAMTAGRLAGDRLAARFGPVLLIRCSGLVAAAGLGAGVASRNPVGGLAGFALLGLGLGPIFPQLVAAAGRLDPARAGRSFARIAGIGYIGSLGGPVVIGFVAGGLGLPAALLIPAALGLVVAAFAGVLRARPAPGRPGTPDPGPPRESAPPVRAASRRAADDREPR
jgi:MFS family permease